MADARDVRGGVLGHPGALEGTRNRANPTAPRCRRSWPSGRFSIGGIERVGCQATRPFRTGQKAVERSRHPSVDRDQEMPAPFYPHQIAFTCSLSRDFRRRRSHDRGRIAALDDDLVATTSVWALSRVPLFTGTRCRPTCRRAPRAPSVPRAAERSARWVVIDDPPTALPNAPTSPCARRLVGRIRTPLYDRCLNLWIVCDTFARGRHQRVQVASCSASRLAAHRPAA